MDKVHLGVDTSNYTTSLSLVCDGKVIKNVRRLLPVKEGEKGLRQSDAVFLHTKALPELASELFSDGYNPENLASVGVSVSPRDEKGSYMPCFLAGISFATAVSASHGIPLYKFSHQAGHIEAGIYSSGYPERFCGEFLSFHVSGGTTEALIVKASEAGYDFEIAGGTNDASAGQIIDRLGVKCGLIFPCGKELDRLSSSADKKLPKSVSIKDTYFSFSGLQNKFERYLDDGESVGSTALFVFESIAGALEKCTIKLREKHGELPVLFAGGVMSNSVIRAVLEKLPDVYFASRELSSDNACGISLLAEKNYRLYMEDKA